MKYGKTERISGIVILLALLAIFVPWLMSDPAPREERPQPTFIIEQPVETARRDVAAPQMPSTVSPPSSNNVTGSDELNAPINASPALPQTDQIDAPSETATANQEPSSSSSEPAPQNDPIADLVAANSSTGSGSQGSSSSSSASGPTSAQQGEWAVQVGSFGDADNARRLGSQLSDEGFSVFQRQRDNNLTTVLVGPYASSEDGEAAMALIKQRANVQGLLVRVRD
ncbi:SPOR domain-containing protein [Vreelandella populi]|uniref:SPOR domain-containing protein n=1 Tax=Vreelandella populi TaxID=2498858 RepID=A0A3S0WQD6_9GAMM|nr:SPOR domain-containing protein [Halomonas populi]RUR40739.1 SPOR domain-containing protein [Halomonas populi]RUR49246.1 SPOR domain-containing protein [Halomonas populi]RUR55736.1 SPOR domain-containing protein [Halomonas populi]